MQVLKSLLRNHTSPEFYREVKSRIFAHDLTHLARIHETDKWGTHWYTPHYEKHFRNLRKKKLRILEIGVGGYEDPNAGGASLRMWKYYFPKSLIFSLDIYDKTKLQERRIKIFQGSQNDPDFLRKLVEQMGGVDIVIDDGSHVNEHVITAFRTLSHFLLRMASTLLRILKRPISQSLEAIAMI